MTLLISRLQFAVTTLFHINWPLLTIGLSLFLLVWEILWLKIKKEIYYRQIRFWSRPFLLIFGLGVASGVPLEFQFGTNWSRFSIASGDLFGNLLAFEAAMAFALEAAFLAIFIFGWHRVSAGMHLFSNVMVAFGASLSAFWIMAANSWMQTPAGAVLEQGKVAITDYGKAIFNPDTGIAFIHVWVASIESTVFFIAGISAWSILRKHHIDFFLRSFRAAVAVGILVAPLQVFLGDSNALSVLRRQPAKSAAMEAHWKTNPPGIGAPWVLAAWPDQAAQKNRWEIKVPYLLSILDTRSLKGQVMGLREIPREDQPPVALPFYSFRLMVILGIVMALLVIWALWRWLRHRLEPSRASDRILFWRLWFCALPLGLVASGAGWIAREVGRQPWVIYGLMRTPAGVSSQAAGTVGASLAAFVAIYATLTILFVHFMGRILKKGPDLASPLPGGADKGRRHMGFQARNRGGHRE